MIRPVIRRLERKILRTGAILGLSHYTSERLKNISDMPNDYRILPMPVDIDILHPNFKRVQVGRIGFSGRFCDPRKNIGLLFAAVKMVRDSGCLVTLELIGDTANESVETMVGELGLDDVVTFTTHFV